MARARAKTKFIPNPSGIKQFATEPQVSAAMERRARAVASATKKNAQMKGYAKSIKVKTRMLSAPRVGVTAGATVYSDWPFSHLEEWGSVNNSPRAPMRRAIAEVGLPPPTGGE